MKHRVSHHNFVRSQPWMPLVAGPLPHGELRGSCRCWASAALLTRSPSLLRIHSHIL